MRKAPPRPPRVEVKASDLAIRELIDCSDGRCLRVIDVLPNSKLVVYDIESKSAQPRIFEFEEVDDLLRLGKWTRAKSTQKRASDEETVETPTEGDPYQEGRWRVVAHIRNPNLYYKKTRGAAIARIAEETGFSQKHVRESFRLAWRGGMDKHSVRSNIKMRGRRGFDTKPRGAKPTIVDYDRYVFPTEAFKKQVRDFAVKHYKKSTLADTCTRVEKRFFSRRNSEGILEPLPLGQRPTERQIHYLVLSVMTAEDRSVRKHGRAQHDLQFDTRVGSVHEACRGPADAYEIDASQVDVWLLSREKGKVRHVIGKATMYLVVDRYSRLIVGFFVSLDPPSWAGAMRAILSIFENKEELCRRHGIAYDPKDWVAHGFMPARFFADRGSEFTGKNSDLIVNNLRVTVTNAKALWAAAKGTVECSFKLVHCELKRDDIGYDPAYNKRVRRAQKTYKNTKLTILQLRRKLLKAVLAHNRLPHDKYQLPPGDIREGLSPVPRDIFTRGLARYGRPAVFDEKEVLQALLCFSPAPHKLEKSNKNPDLLESGGAVQADGVRFGGCMYTSDVVRKAGWMLRAAQGKSFRVHVRHDLGIVKYIYATNPAEPERTYRLHLTSDYEAYAGYTRYEVLNLDDVRKETEFWNKEARKADRLRRADEAEREDPPKPEKVTKTRMAQHRSQEKQKDRADSRNMPPTEHDVAVADALVEALAHSAHGGQVVPFTKSPSPPDEQPSARASKATPPAAPAVAPAPGGITDIARNRLLRNLTRNS